MRLPANENVFAPMVEALRAKGYEVVTAEEAGLRSARDEQVFERAVRGRFTLLTLDKDFTRSRRFNPKRCRGIIVGKLFKMPVDQATRTLVEAMESLKEEEILGKLVIVTRSAVRIRTGRA